MTHRLSPTRPIHARQAPRDDDRCGWLATAGEAPAPRPPLTGEVEADAVIVGAGLTGLAAARRLAELDPAHRVVVLDAQRAGFGASARSSGFVVDIAYFTTAMEPAAAAAHIRLSRAGIDALRRQVAAHGIECAWDDTGWIHAAAGDAGMRDLETLARWLDDHGEAYDDLDSSAMEQAVGTPFYRRGLRMPGRPLVHPAALVQGLAATLAAGVTLYERSPVREIAPAGAGRSGWRVATERGGVTAPRVILAVNGYAPRLGVLGREIFPLVTFGSFTRPLTDAELERLGGEREWGLLAQDPLGSSLRRTRDQRILVRNTLHYSRELKISAAVSERARRAHRQALVRRWPSLFGERGAGGHPIELETTWAGVMGASPSRRPLFGELADGVWAAAGFTGAGIALGTIAGELLAEWSCGKDSELLRDLQALPGPGRTPPEPFLSLGIRFQVARMNASAGATL